MTKEDFELHKIITIAGIAGRLVYASMRMTGHRECIDGIPAGDDEIEFPLKPERAAQIAEQIFDAAENRILLKTSQDSLQDLRLLRLGEKLRANTLSGDERVELLEIMKRWL